MTLGGGSVTEGKKRKVLTVILTSKTGYLTSRTAPPRMTKEVERAPHSVKMASSRVNIEASVTVPPACYTRAGKASIRTTTSNGPAQNTR